MTSLSSASMGCPAAFVQVSQNAGGMPRPTSRNNQRSPDTGPLANPARGYARAPGEMAVIVLLTFLLRLCRAGPGGAHVPPSKRAPVRKSIALVGAMQLEAAVSVVAEDWNCADSAIIRRRP